MLDTLDARLGQAQAGELGHLEFLQVLRQDEIGRGDAAALDRRLRAARFEQTVTIEDYDFGFNPKIPAAHIRDLATLRFVDNGESVVLHGPVGVGKSMIAQALGHAACRHGHSVAFAKTSRLLANLAGGHADRSWETRLRRWARPSLLILDDFAMRQFSTTQADDLYELISERAGRSLIITANRSGLAGLVQSHRRVLDHRPLVDGEVFEERLVGSDVAGDHFELAGDVLDRPHSGAGGEHCFAFAAQLIRVGA
jgi:DNA replication protein DnaC